MRKLVEGEDGTPGLANLETYDLREGTTQFMGASRHPDLIYIEEVGEDRVTYRTRPFHPEDTMTESREVVEDLVAQGNRTVKERDHHWAHLADADTDLNEIKRVEITYRVSKDLWESFDEPKAREIERRWNNSTYGLESNMGVGERTFKTTVTKEQSGRVRNELDGVQVLSSDYPG